MQKRTPMTNICEQRVVRDLKNKNGSIVTLPGRSGVTSGIRTFDSHLAGYAQVQRRAGGAAERCGLRQRVRPQVEKESPIIVH
jgi:hypothetical protein